MKKTVATILAEELKKNKINDLFMLTGYGAMYLNDAIERANIKFYAARNEAAAPMMASAYAKHNNKIGAVCVTAGPGATNAFGLKSIGDLRRPMASSTSRCLLF